VEIYLFLYYFSLELSIYKIHYIISNIPPLEDPEQNSDYELWGGSGNSLLVQISVYDHLRAALCMYTAPS
jgi:hypothetical protein